MKYPHAFMVSLYNDAREALARAVDDIFKDARFLLIYSQVSDNNRAELHLIERCRYRLDDFGAVKAAVLFLKSVRAQFPERYDHLLWCPEERRLLDVLLDRIHVQSITPYSTEWERQDYFQHQTKPKKK